MFSNAIGMRIRVSILALTLALSLSACLSITPVQPWEKGQLAKPDMAFDADPLDKLFKEHTYSSKESALGGAGVGGGGCGCN
jgi:starvation-inducible outer membrane lipoprotein